MGTIGIDWNIILAAKCFCQWDWCVKSYERERGQPITEWNMMKYVNLRSAPSGAKFLAMHAITIMLSVNQ